MDSVPKVHIKSSYLEMEANLSIKKQRQKSSQVVGYSGNPTKVSLKYYSLFQKSLVTLPRKLNPMFSCVHLLKPEIKDNPRNMLAKLEFTIHCSHQQRIYPQLPRGDQDFSSPLVIQERKGPQLGVNWRALSSEWGGSDFLLKRNWPLNTFHVQSDDYIK
jgi:hypothetical protein